MKADRKAPWKAAVTAVVAAAAGALVGGVLARAGMRSPHVLSSLQALSAWDLLALPVLWIGVLAFHEAGHLAGGMSRGMRFLLFVAGPFGLFRGADGIRFRWCFNLGALNGIAATLPGPGPLEPQLRRLVWAGPAASLLLAGLAAWACFAAEGRVAAYALVVALASGGIFVLTALPFRAGGFMSDGMQLLQLRRDPTMVERRTRLTALVGMSMSGARPRDMDPALLASAQALTGVEANYDVGVWLYSYGHALDAGDVAGASAWLDQVEALYASYPDGLRQALAVEFALFEAFYRRRQAEADGWLARSRGGLVDASRRGLAEAAAAALSGRRDEALRHLARAEATLGRSLDPGFARLGARQIEALRSELG